MQVINDKVILAAIVAITIMEVVAMVYLHLNGVYLSTAVATIAAIVSRRYTQRECDNDGRIKLDDGHRNRSRIAPSVGLDK